MGKRYKSWDCQGFRTRIFESGNSIFVKRLPGAIGKYPYPLTEETRAPAKVSGPTFVIVKERAASGARQDAMSVPLIVFLMTFPLFKVTSSETLMRSPTNEISGVNPDIAMVSGVSAGAEVLHRKSFLPDTVTVDLIAANTGSVEVIRTAKTVELIFGVNWNSVTMPALTAREVKPTGTKTPSDDKTSAVTFASTSPGVNTLKVWGKAELFLI